ncbi:MULTISPECIES: TonB-dependent receptor [unclassified Janthinobacterium]|uniref:TonB-dependent receptor n=1 Tax=unclassified Janthinobacterium TaxID=2610881 RepID=UPI00161A4206|nr:MULTISPECIES: TonB-dependent receptor [unclassified Janthinobacterium]MBB5610604.1 iron complex outermembrane receptor protein [Janthinobacterium sp. S3T4]MBB5616090.1 iron complex outermembrane receptor protein [Janthinobacterium sp. S3M3]
MMTLHAGMVHRTLIALAVTAAFPLQAMADDPAPAPDAPAAAQTDTPAAAPAASGPGQLETVIVTAQRRAENIKDVPMSIATLKGEKLDVLTAGGQDIRFLSGRSPSVSVESDYGRTFPRFYIRGLGNTDFDLNASQPVGLVMDDVVQENAMLKGFPVFDVDQVEVLRGPQGTLFGRNSPAGVIKFDSAKPVFNTEGYLSGGFGKDGVKNLEGVFNIPLSDTVALRFSGQTQRRDNRVHNPRPTGTRDFEGYEDNAARIQLLVKPSRDFSALFNVHARDLDGTATLFRANILKQGTNDLVDNFDYGSYPTDGINRQHLKTKGGSMRLKWDLDGVTLNSITGYEKLDFYSRADVDGGYGAVYAPPMGPGFIPFVVETADVIPNHKQISQELRAESNSKGPWQWIAGLFYFKEDIQIDSISFDSLSPGNPQNPFYSTQNQSSTSYAAFGSLNYTVSDALKLRGGLRYTSDKKDFSAKRVELTTAGPFNIDNTSHNVSWDLSGTYILTPATNVYARVATGYRAPSMQGRLNGLSDRPSFAGAEKALSVEAGIKQDLFDKRARLSLAVFQYRVKDKQLTAGSGAVNMNQLINADKVTGQGVELDFQANLSDSVSMTLGGSYNHTEIQDKNLFVQSCGNALNNPASGCTVTNPVGPFVGTAYINGNPLPRAPEWQGNFTLKYSIPVANGEFFAYTDWTYRTSYNFFLYEAKEYKAKPLLEGGLRAGYKWDKYEIAAYSRNITNRIQAVGAIDFDNLTGILNEPRTYGVQFKATF